MTPQRVVERLRATDVTGRADAGLDDVTTDGLVAEEMIERGDAGDGGGLDVCQFAKPLQRGRREPVPACLHRLQEGNQVIRVTPDARDHGVHFRDVRRAGGLATTGWVGA